MSSRETLPPVVERFLRYVAIDTQADRDSETTPSSERQKELGRLLAEELEGLGARDVVMDEHGYVYATVPSNLPAEVAGATPVLALLAHQDTSPDEPGGPVEPVIHRSYDGSVVSLPGDRSVKLDPARSPALAEHVGHDLITSDGTTLLGSDDKAGVAIIMQLVEELLAGDDGPRPELRVCFTVDEEIGRGVDRLDRDRLGATVAYTVDGGGVGKLNFETFHAAEASVVVHGVNVHPGYAKGVMANAVRVLTEILDGLPGGESPATTAGREGYFFAHEMHGNPTRAEAKVLLRDFDAQGMARRKRLLEALVEAARLAHPRARVELTMVDQYKNMREYIEATDPRAISFAFRAAEAMGLELEEELVRGGTDGARLSEMGIPTPNLFTGGHDFHSRFEWNTVQNLETALGFVLEVVRTWGAHGHEAAEGTDVSTAAST